MPHRTVALVLLAAAATASGLTHTDISGGAPKLGSAGCNDSRLGRTVLRSSILRVYRASDGTGALAVCPYDRPGDLTLQLNGLWFRPPALDVTGRLIGVAALPPEEGSFSVTVFEATAVGDPLRVVNDVLVPIADSFGVVRVAADGSVVFSVCPEEGSRPDPRYTLNRCRRPGRWVGRIYYVPPRVPEPGLVRQLRVLDRGSRLDVASLRLSGRRVSWVRGGKRRTATLPPARAVGR